MDTSTLVENQIDDGKKLIEDLTRHGFPITTAFWLRPTEDGRWYFTLVSPLVDSEGIAQAYQRLHPVVWARPQPCAIDPLKITLIGLDNPIAKDVLAIQRTAPGPRICAIRGEGIRLGNVSVDGAYIYPLPVTIPT